MEWFNSLIFKESIAQIILLYAFVISGGIEREFLERLEQVGTLDVPNVTGVNLGRLWDLSGGIWKRTGFDILQKYFHPV